MTEIIKNIPIANLYPHPENPRMAFNEDVVQQIVGQIAITGFDPAHALLTRPIDGGYQIISGHHRIEAAKRAGLEEVPCFVREMSDDDAYMQLLLCNTQTALHPIEEGLHALRFVKKGYAGGKNGDGTGKKGGLREYVRMLNMEGNEVKESSLREKIKSAEVVSYCATGRAVTLDQFKIQNLVAIHQAPESCWQFLVGKMLAEGWTKEQAQKIIEPIKSLKNETIPEWMDIEKAVMDIMGGINKPSDIKKMVDRVHETTVKNSEFQDGMLQNLIESRPHRMSQVVDIVTKWERKQQDLDSEARRKKEAAIEHVLRLRESCSLDKWKGLTSEEQTSLLIPNKNATNSFNPQKSAAIEWAQFSWNPVTGCKHECSYCYARDIANQSKMSRTYPNGFEPTFRSDSLNAPYHQKVPDNAQQDERYRNVFTCSMADLFGRWVPEEWINAVLKSVRDNPQWNFLFLTKFPNRIAEFDIPQNAWMGTTVDLQARVANAEKAFEKINCKVRWLSVEPMLEPLKFTRLDLFDWVVIGGASSSSKTPEWHPPFPWIASLVDDCRKAGAKVYFKENLLGNRILELPFEAPIIIDPMEAPQEFHYLKIINKNARAYCSSNIRRRRH